VRFVHDLHAGALSADVAGLLGARLGGLISLELPVAPGFVIETAAWHLSRVLGEAWNVPETVAEEVRDALGELDGRLLAVRAAPAVPGVPAGPPWTPPAEQLELALGSIARQAPVPTAVIVQAHTCAEGKPPCGHGRAFTRDPQHGTVWPVGEFRSGRSVVSLDELSRWLPAVGLQLRTALARVESLHRTVCEVSFTVEAGRLWIDDARPTRHSRAAAERIAQSGLGEPAPRLRRAQAAGPGS
jgi:hypothetical protein